MLKLRSLVGVTALALSLTACDFFSTQWEAKDGACRAISSENTVMAAIQRDRIAFMELEPGCPSNLDILGSRFTEIEINGNRYAAMMVCNDATHNRNITTVGTFKMAVKEKAALAALSVKAAAEFTGTFGAKVALEGQTARFYRGNFASVCPQYLPRLTLADLQQSLKTTQQQSHLPQAHVAAEKPTPPPSPVELTPEIYQQALERAQSTYLLSHPGTNLSDMAWEEIHRPDQERNGQMMRMLRYTTFNPATGITSDVDVEITPDGTVGYSINKDRPSPAAPVTAPPPPPSPEDRTINAFCMLDNGKSVSVYATEGRDYHYTYRDKNDRPELELVEGLFGVKAFHYFAPFGMGTAHYIRFNKGTYDYVLLSTDNGRQEFQGVRAYNNGNLIASHECTTPLSLNTEHLPKNDHFDNEKMGDYLLY